VRLYYWKTGKVIDKSSGRTQIHRFKDFLDELSGRVPHFGFRPIMIRCSGCNRIFEWTVPEQMWFEAKGYKVTPKHCPGCKSKSK